MSILEVKGLKKIYSTRFGGNKVEALRNVNFSVEQGEYVAVMGESGSGKTTLLNILAALDKPTNGSVILDGNDLSSIKESAVASFRRDNLGFVFQDFNLLDTFTIEDNIYLPLVLAGKSYKEMNGKLEAVASRLGIQNILKKYPYEVSGGQKQRAAVARAIITSPKLILADRRSRFKIYRRAAAPFQRYQFDGADDRYGYPLGQGGKLRKPHPFHQGRRGFPPDLQRCRHGRTALSEDIRHPYYAGDRR